MRRLLSCLLLCLLPLLVHAADAPRPKIGLVLSGGAARGLAHIGVLKALEEQGIHIDAIAGTSMGAVIGGLYASGYKIDELEKLALGIDWQQALSDAPPREDVPFRRKQDDRDFLVKQKLSFRDDGSLGLPLGVIQGQNLALLLESMFAHSSNIRNFDKLPIPFRAVATDITTGEKVVFSKGHLPQVIRASMSIPAVFAPVELDGRLLVDGGMTDNIPLDVAREMGVDIAIVVDIGTPLRSRKQLATVVDVLNQSITLMTRRNSEEQLKDLHPKDVLIQPPLAAYGVTDFGRAKDMIDAGYRATRALDIRLAPKMKKNQAAIDVRFTYDVNGVLQVESTVLGTGEKHELILQDNPGVLDEAEIRERLASLSALKVHPREDQANLATIARIERLYEERLDLRGQLQDWLARFMSILEGQDRIRIERERGELSRALDQLEAQGID